MSVFYAIAQFINESTVARSLVFGLLAAIALTQFVKFLFPASIPDREHRILTQATAFAVGTAVCALTWPLHAQGRAPFSFTIGLCSPLGYKLAVAVLYHYLPWIEPYLSARPRTTP